MLGLPDLLTDERLFAFIHLLAASAVTAHVLLRKQTVRAAIGWIGLVWLSPIFGAVLYYVFGINRVSRRAARLNRAIEVHTDTARGGPGPALSEHINVIERVVERLTGRVLTSGNVVSALQGGDEAYPAMLSAIRNARRSVALASYIFGNDEVGRSFIEALTEAQARGVRVRVLIDGIGGGYIFSPVVRALRKNGIPVARFLHYWRPWRMPYLNMRNHKKILVVDGSIGFTGGINIAGENLLARHPRNPIHDIHFRVDGPVVRHLMETFADDWRFTTGELLDADDWWPEIRDAGSVWARGISSGPDEAVGRLEAVLATAVFAAKRRLRIVTPYFLPDEHLMSAIDLSALRGISVDIVLPEHSDHALIDWAMRAHLGLLPSNIRIHLTSRPFSHAKLMTVDGHWCLIGTANWDVRSTRLNFEFNLECYDDAATTEIDRIIDAAIRTARCISSEELTARSLPFRLRDAAVRLLLPYL